MKYKKFLRGDITLVYLILLTMGCQKQPLVPDPNIEYLEQWSQTSWIATDSKNSIEKAINLYKNNTIDSDPILLCAWLGRPSGYEEMYLGFLIYDEQMDVVGVIIKEQSDDSNKYPRSIEEDYPVFIHNPMLMSATTYQIPIQNRAQERRKDKNIWDNYIKSGIRSQIANMEISNQEGDRIADTETLVNKQNEFWKNTLPAIYVSIPEPNMLTVDIQIYDKAGNKSNIVKLIDRTKH